MYRKNVLFPEIKEEFVYKRKIVIHLGNKEVSSSNVEDHMKNTTRPSHMYLGYKNGDYGYVIQHALNSTLPNACGVARLESIDRKAINITICIPYTIDDNGKFIANCNDGFFDNVVKGILIERLYHIIKAFQLKTSDIISHHEAYLADMADNYYSVEEWFKQNNYSMDELRMNVSSFILMDNDTTYDEYTCVDNRDRKIYRVVYDEYLRAKDKPEFYDIMKRLNRVTIDVPHLIHIGSFDFIQLYASYDKNRALERLEDLQNFGYAVYLMEKDISMDYYVDTLDFVSRTKTNFIHTSDPYIVLTTLKAINTPYADEEVGYYIDDSESLYINDDWRYRIINGVKEAWVYDRNTKKYIQICSNGDNLIELDTDYTSLVISGEFLDENEEEM